MKNELEICRLVNECSVMKRELEQKEKTIEDLGRELGQKTGSDKILEKRVMERVENKLESLRRLR